MDIKINSLHPFDALDGNIWITDELYVNPITQLQII